MTIPDRAPGVVWGMRHGFRDGYVTTDVNDTIIIVAPGISWTTDTGLAGIQISRVDAALFARRIRQCLDAITKPVRRHG